MNWLLIDNILGLGFLCFYLIKDQSGRLLARRKRNRLSLKSSYEPGRNGGPSDSRRRPNCMSF